MKKILTIVLAAGALAAASSCTAMLEEKHDTRYTTSYVTGSPEGLKLMTAALYAYQRKTFAEGSDNNELMNMMNRFSDISCSAASSGEQMGVYNPTRYSPSEKVIGQMWTYIYGVVGRCNEIINAAEAMNAEDPELARCQAEAKLFRAQMFFLAYRIWDRILLNTTTVDYTNVDGGIVYRPATKEEVFTQLNNDVNDGIAALDWLSNQPGRWNKAAAYHLKAKIAMEEGKYDTALKCIDEIEASGKYSLVSNTYDLFLKSDNLNNSEGLLVQQWSMEVGGNLSDANPKGNGFNRWYTTQYRKVMGGADNVCTFENGCKGAGCIIPNYYLLSLYDQDIDTRYKDWFITQYKNTTNKDYKYDGDIIVHPGEYFPTIMKNGKRDFNLMPGCRKFLDIWNVLPYEANNYKDIMVYRLAESYIIGAEAALRGNNMAKALYYYNKTWKRAGNAERTEALTIRDIMDEHARELCFENGERYFFLKRLGVYMEEYCAHAGEADVRSSTNGRKNLADNPHFLTFPIPEAEILAMGAENFPQNPGY